MDKIRSDAELIEEMTSSWRSMRMMTEFSDLVISTKTKKFPAHKNVLAGNKTTIVLWIIENWIIFKHITFYLITVRDERLDYLF